jgi:hypothetical protein
MEIVDPGPYESTLDYDVLKRLDQTMARAEHGVAHDLVTPLVSRRDPTAGRELRIKEASNAILSTGYRWLDEAELDQREKIGPYSIMEPWSGRIDGVLKYFEARNISYNASAMSYARNALISELGSRKLFPSTVNTAFDEMPRGTNLGLPWLSRSKEYLPEVLDKVRDVVGHGYSFIPLDPAILYWRGQPRGLHESPKQRVIWGFPHWLTVIELMLQIPLLEALKHKSGFSAWLGSEFVNFEVTTLIDQANVDILSVDFSGYDASVPKVLIHECFNVLRDWFDDSAFSLINFVEYAFTEIQLLTPGGLYGGRDGAIPSGSGLTNLIGSLVQKLAFYYVSYRLKLLIRKHLTQGDDGVVLFDRPWLLEDVSDVMLELNLKVSADKGGVSRERVYFLQNVHSTDYRWNGATVGVRPFFKVLNGALSYERFREKGKWVPADDSFRWLQQWEAARYHPKFPEAVSLLYKWDRYLQMYSIRELLNKAGGMRELKSVLENKGFPYGKEGLGGIHDFRVVRELQDIKARHVHKGVLGGAH